MQDTIIYLGGLGDYNAATKEPHNIEVEHAQTLPGIEIEPPQMEAMAESAFCAVFLVNAHKWRINSVSFYGPKKLSLNAIPMHASLICTRA